MAVDPQTITIEVNLAEVVVARGEDGQTFADYIASLAAAALLQRSTKEDYYGALKRAVEQFRETEIRAALVPLIQAAVEESFQPTNEYGSPKGQPTTLRELIAKQVTVELRVHKERDGYSRPQTSLLEDVVKEQVRRELRGELRQAVAEGRASVLAAVKEQAAEVISETIARVTRA